MITDHTMSSDILGLHFVWITFWILCGGIKWQQITFLSILTQDETFKYNSMQEHLNLCIVYIDSTLL